MCANAQAWLPLPCMVIGRMNELLMNERHVSAPPICQWKEWQRSAISMTLVRSFSSIIAAILMHNNDTFPHTFNTHVSVNCQQQQYCISVILIKHCKGYQLKVTVSLGYSVYSNLEYIQGFTIHYYKVHSYHDVLLTGELGKSFNKGERLHSVSYHQSILLSFNHDDFFVLKPGMFGSLNLMYSRGRFEIEHFGRQWQLPILLLRFMDPVALV